MNAIPAAIAGVGEIIMVTPPQKDGTIAPLILAAAQMAGVHRIFKIGGAQAIAALAFGTESVPAVDKIVGPGNAWVAAAQRLVFGRVGIDMIAGPSELMIVADASCNPAFAAADLLSQAEHDPAARPILATPCESLANAVSTELERQIPRLSRADIARRSVDENGLVILTRDLAEAVAAAEKISPEHLELCVEEPFALLDSVRCAGAVFLGHHAPEALGDYFAGPNHVLPTSGTARFSSGLGVDDFVRRSNFVYYSEDALEKAQSAVAAFARREGLDAHAKSVEIRF
jgi:histidinol dehydrogenase